MDKTLSNKDNKPKPEGASTAAESPSFGAYGAGVAPDLSQNAWDKSKKAWSDSPQGRLAIRTFSRGILGAAFFAAGGALSRKWMHSDNVRYDINKPFFGSEDKPGQANPLQFIAKLIDTTAGKAIKTTVRTVAKMAGKTLEEAEHLGDRSVHFRQWKYKGFNDMRGRSLGEEAVGVTFDFFCASVGDAWGRDIAGWFDPNVKKSWLKNGKIDMPDAVKSALKSVARYVTYNGGEDWAVAIPYVYYMAASRKAINKYSPGFEYDPGHNLSGGAFKVDKNGHLIGNYNLEGIADLQGRFTVYNMGTLAYREFYNFIGDKIKGQPASLYGAPDNKKSTLFGGVANSFKWLVRSAIKGGIYMTPAVPFFWITRTPQSKRRGVFINPELGQLGYEDVHTIASKKGQTKFEIIEASHVSKIFESQPNKEVYFTRHAPEKHIIPGPGEIRSGEFIQSRHAPAQNYEVLRGKFMPFEKSFGIADAPLNSIGRWNTRLAGKANDFVGKYDQTKWGQKVWQTLDVKSLRNLSQSFVDASIAYTPYMYMKAETAELWDTGKTDMALERMIDGAAKLNWGEFKAGVAETRDAILHRTFADANRELEAHRRDAIKETRSDASFRVNSGVLDKDKAEEEKEVRSWRERLFHGAAPKKESKPEPNKKPVSHAEREDMRKALNDLAPPTNSVH